MKNKLLLSILGGISILSLSGCITNTSSSSSASQGSTTSQQTTSTTSTSMDNVYEGEYKETTYGQEYVAKVKVTVENGTIKKVEIKEGSNVVTDKDSWPENTKWTSKEQEYLKSFEGKTIESIKESSSNVVDNVAGATLTANRIYQAIKDALK